MVRDFMFRTRCNSCGKSEDGMVSKYQASGDSHYCKECWPSTREWFAEFQKDPDAYMQEDRL